jgi:hypothetical protein
MPNWRSRDDERIFDFVQSAQVVQANLSLFINFSRPYSDSQREIRTSRYQNSEIYGTLPTAKATLRCSMGQNRLPARHMAFFDARTRFVQIVYGSGSRLAH